jgi:hypothetical protein
LATYRVDYRSVRKQRSALPRGSEKKKYAFASAFSQSINIKQLNSSLNNPKIKKNYKHNTVQHLLNKVLCGQ